MSKVKNGEYSPSTMAKLLGVTVRTIQNWDENGKLPARRKPGSDRRYYLKEDLEQYLERNGKSGAKTGLSVAYVRSYRKTKADQAHDAAHQLSIIRNYLNMQLLDADSIDKIYYDVADGTCLKNRPNFMQLLKDCAGGGIQRIYVADEYRIHIADFDFFRKYLQDMYGVSLIAIDDIGDSADVARDVFNMLGVYSEYNRKTRIQGGPNIGKYQMTFYQEYGPDSLRPYI